MNRRHIEDGYTLGYVITRLRGFRYLIGDSYPLEYSPDLSLAKLYERRVDAWGIIAERFPNHTWKQAGLDVRRVKRCEVCDGGGTDCSRCRGSGKEVCAR